MILRNKSRYILLEASEDVDLQDKSSFFSFRNNAISFLGESSYSKANPRFMLQYNSRAFIIKVNRGFEDQFILCSSFIKSLNNKEIGFYTISTSGSIKKLVEKCNELYDKELD